MSDYTNTFQREIDICENVYVFSVPADSVDDYVADSDGNVYVIGGAADDTYAITGGWRSKQLDFSDKYPELKDNWKQISYVQIKYKDIYSSTPIAVYISNDGGETWAFKLRSLGDGDETIKVANFYFLDSEKSTGRSFIIRIESSSSTTSFEWHGISIWFRPRGKYFEVS